MSIRDASVESYADLKDQESGQLAKFERWFKDHGPATRAMAGHALEFPANVYSSRVNKLVNEKKLVELPEKKPCQITGHTAGWLVHRHRVTVQQLGIQLCVDCQKPSSGIYTMTTNICCAARFVLSTSGDIAVAVEATAHRYGYDLEELKLAVNAMHRDRRERAVAASARVPASNEEIV